MIVPEIAGRAVILKPWKVADAEWYVNARDEVIFEFTTESRDLTVEQMADVIVRASSSIDLAPFAIWTEDGQLVGNLALSIQSGKAEISYFLAPEGRGRGLASEAIRTALSWSMNEFDIDEVVASVAITNVASARVLERVGFVEIGRSQHEVLGETREYSFSAPPNWLAQRQ